MIVVHVEHRVLAVAAPVVDRLGRQRVLAGPRHQRDPAHVPPRRPRQPVLPFGRPPEHLEVELRDPVPERRQVEVLEHDIGGPAIRRRRIVPLDRRDQRVGQLRLGSPVQPDRHPRLIEHDPVRPDPPDAQHRPLARGHRDADRVGVLAHRGPATLAADLLLVHRLEEAARPDQVACQPHAPEDARDRRALARSHHPEPLDPPGLDRLGAGPEQPLVDRRAERRADRLAEHRRPDPGDAAAERAAERRAGGGQQQRGHQRLLSGKRKAPAIRRDQAGVSGDSTTP